MAKNRITSYSGRIDLSRELTFTQAQQIDELALNKGIRVAPDGRGLIWDQVAEEGVANILSEVIAKTASWGIMAVGVLHVVKPAKRTYDIVVISNKVKRFEKNQISSI